MDNEKIMRRNKIHLDPKTAYGKTRDVVNRKQRSVQMTVV